jgi:hypothetical protein
MKLTSLEIKLQPTYCDNAGKYVATIEYEDKLRNTMKLVLDPQVSGQLLGFIGPVITAAATRAAKEIEANIIGSLEASNPTLELADKTMTEEENARL